MNAAQPHPVVRRYWDFVLEPSNDAAVRSEEELADELRALLRRAVARGARRPLQGDGAALPLRARSFESVLAVRLFQLVDDPRPILAELARVLRPGGVLAVTPVWPSRPRDAIGRAYWDAGQRVRAWTRRLAAAASDAGFRDHRTARGPRQSTRRSPNE